MKRSSPKNEGTSFSELASLLTVIERRGEEVPERILQLANQLKQQIEVSMTGKSKRNRGDGNLMSTAERMINENYDNDKTRSCYIAAFRKFNDWCDQRGISLGDATYPNVAPYLREMKDQYKLATLRATIAAIRTIYDLLMVHGYVGGNPIPQLRAPDERANHLPQGSKILTLEEVQDLLSSFDTTKPVELRNRAMMGLMVYAFAPLDSLSDLQVCDYMKVDQVQCMRMTVRGKTHFIPLHSEACQFVEEYLEAIDFKHKSDAVLFPSCNRSLKLSNRKMERHSMWRLVSVAGQRINLEKLMPTSLRLTGITAFLLSNQSREDSDSLIGYRDTKTRARYDLLAGDNFSTLHKLFDTSSDITKPLRDFVKQSRIFELEDDAKE